MRGLLFVLLFLSHAHVGFCVLKKALIFGVTGQDGVYLTDFLLEKGYEVHGVKRPSSLKTVIAFEKNRENFCLHYGDVTDRTAVFHLLHTIRPDEIYNLAAQSRVSTSFAEPGCTVEVNVMGTLHILEAIRDLGLISQTKFYQASTSELFGCSPENPRTETTPFYPCSPYGTSKLFAHWITINYRDAFGLFACCGILFNHESPHREKDFVTRKIARAAAEISRGSTKICYLGNLNAQRDWGYAKDYVEAMWLMLQQEKPEDFVIATGQSHSVREFASIAFKTVGIDIEWRGSGVDEVGIDKKTGATLVQVDPKFFRPTDILCVCGDAKKVNESLHWRPKTSFAELVKTMVLAELTDLDGDEK